MRINRQSLPAAATLVVRGPAQLSIDNFLSTHRALPPRGRWARLFGRSPLTETSSRAFWGAVGQLRVAAELDALGSEWFVAHGVPGPCLRDEEEPSWIDHLVIGPSGVFTVTAYDHARQNVWANRQAVVVDGHRLPYIRIAQTQVGYLERVLGDATGDAVDAAAIVAVIDPGSLQVRDLPRDVAVIASAQLLATLRSDDRQIEAERVQELAALVERDSSCSSESNSLTEQQSAAMSADRAEFARVRREVGVAQIIRTCWTLGVAGLVVTVLVAVGILQLLSDRTAGL